MTEKIVVGMIAAERVRLPDGREFTGLNCETNAARALLASGTPRKAVVEYRWPDGRLSQKGRLDWFARWSYSEGDSPLSRSWWQPHPRAEMCETLKAWAAEVAAMKEAARVTRQKEAANA